MRLVPSLVLLSLVLSACAGSSPAVSSEDYGYSQEAPIRVAGLADRGPASERAYLDRLRDADGNPVTYERQGSCCAFRTPNGMIDDTGLLDMYEVTRSDGSTVVLYLNMYDPPQGELRAPAGFTLAP